MATDRRRPSLTALGLTAGSAGVFAFGALGSLGLGTAAMTAVSTLLFADKARANAELDRKYALETLGALRAWDNVDGLFADYVAAAYKDYFAAQTRFRHQDLGKADALLGGAKTPYLKVIEDAEILGQLTRSLKTQSLLRTKVFKEGPRYRFTIDWLHAPQMEVLASETFNLEDQGAIKGATGGDQRDFAGLGDIKSRIKTALDKLFAQVPFVGHVTGRDQGDVTVNLGGVSGVKRGDTLVVGTIDEVKRHPLLKQIVEWRITNVGKVDVDSVDEALAFGHITDQEEGREIGRYQKILRIIPRPEKIPTTPSAIVTEANPIDEPPKLGYAGVALWTGSFSRQFSSDRVASAPLVNSGSGFMYGARGYGEIWLNREFFFDIEMGYGTFGFSQTRTSTATTAADGSAIDSAAVTPSTDSVTGSIFTLTGSLGYTYAITGNFFGPRAWVKIGYGLDSVTLPVSQSPDALAPFSVKSAFLGIGGDVPIRHNVGGRIDLAFGLYNSGSQTSGESGAATSSHNARITIGGYYKYRPRVSFLGSLEIQGTGSEFSKASLSQRTVTFLPAVQYLF